MAERERIVIFGASLGGERGLRSLGARRRAVAFCDNDASKQGKRWHGLPVLRPEELEDAGYDRVLIASSYYPEIFHQLVDLGVPVERIDILDPDILSGVDEPSVRVYWLLAGIVVVLALAAYGLVRLTFG